MNKNIPIKVIQFYLQNTIVLHGWWKTRYVAMTSPESTCTTCYLPFQPSENERLCSLYTDDARGQMKVQVVQVYTAQPRRGGGGTYLFLRVKNHVSTAIGKKSCSKFKTKYMQFRKVLLQITIKITVQLLQTGDVHAKFLVLIIINVRQQTRYIKKTFNNTKPTKRYVNKFWFSWINQINCSSLDWHFNWNEFSSAMFSRHCPVMPPLRKKIPFCLQNNFHHQSNIHAYTVIKLPA